MSATRRGARRAPRDRYDTPEWCVHRLLDRLAVTRPELISDRADNSWMEPAVGSGNIVRAVDAWFAQHQLGPRHWWLNDIAPRVPPGSLPWTVRELDVRRGLELHGESLGVGITNPPYRLALAFALEMLRACGTAALLLRLNWLEGAVAREPDRASFLRAHPPDVYVLPNRPAFERKRSPRSRKVIRKGTDATAYAWMLWDREGNAGTCELLDETPREERRR